IIRFCTSGRSTRRTSKGRPRSICARAATRCWSSGASAASTSSGSSPAKRLCLKASPPARLSLLRRISRLKPKRHSTCPPRCGATSPIRCLPHSSRRNHPSKTGRDECLHVITAVQPAGGLVLQIYPAGRPFTAAAGTRLALVRRARFLLSGLTKIHDWSVTLALFENEYHVPVLSPSVAAALGTATELSMPVLLALGLGTRFAAAVLFVFNIVAVMSYPDLPDIAVKDH